MFRTASPTLTSIPRIAVALLVVTCLACPAVVQAADIAWREVTSKKAEMKEKFTRAGTATLSDGEQATVTIEGEFSPKETKGTQSFKARSVLRFKDKSTINVQYTGTLDIGTYASRGKGKLVGGTGRFAGIKGTVAFEGRPSDVQWTGTYTLPRK